MKEISKINLYTIGFTKKTAKVFFEKIQSAGVKTLIDIRLNNISQLAGFTKRDDLIYFLKEICDCKYRHEPNFAPTKEILNDYKKNKIDWNEYKLRFNNLIEKRKIEKLITPDELNDSCLLCSEPYPEYCHRILIAKYFMKKFHNIQTKHL